MFKVTAIALLSFLIVFFPQVMLNAEVQVLTSVELAFILSFHYGLGVFVGGTIMETSK